MQKPRAKKCKVCKEVFHPERLFQEACNYRCALNLAEIKRKKKEKKQNAEQKRKYYDNDIKTRREAAVRTFNGYIRLRDQGMCCISCNKPCGSWRVDAGHYIPAGNCTALRFNEFNVNAQCHFDCNVNQSGNRTEYRKGILNKYGQEVVDFLEGPQPTIKITVQFYKDIEDKYKLKIKELKGKQNE